MTNANVLAIASPGSQALKNAKYERYCRLRASAQPRIQAYREVGWGSREGDLAYINACRLERRSEIRDRIAYLTRQAEELITEKRQRIEERLWAIHEANIQDFFTTENDLDPTEGMLNLSARADAADVTRLSDQKPLQTLAQQARELGIEIDLNYTFAQPKKAVE